MKQIFVFLFLIITLPVWDVHAVPERIDYCAASGSIAYDGTKLYARDRAEEKKISEKFDNFFSFSVRFKYENIFFSGVYLGKRRFLVNSHSIEAMLPQIYLSDYLSGKRLFLEQSIEENGTVYDTGIKDLKISILLNDKLEKIDVNEFDLIRPKVEKELVIAGKKVYLPDMAIIIVPQEYERLLSDATSISIEQNIDDVTKELLLVDRTSFHYGNLGSIIEISSFTIDYVNDDGIVSSDFIGKCNDAMNITASVFPNVFPKAATGKKVVGHGFSGSPVIYNKGGAPHLHSILFGDSTTTLTFDSIDELRQHYDGDKSQAMFMHAIPTGDVSKKKYILKFPSIQAFPIKGYTEWLLNL